MKVSTEVMDAIHAALADGTATEGPTNAVYRGDGKTYTVEKSPTARKPKKGKLLPESFCIEQRANGARVARWQLPLLTVSEANNGKWKVKSGRVQAAWNAVGIAFGPRLDIVAEFVLALHAGTAVQCTFTRVGGRELDPFVNLPSAMKALEDSVIYFFGVSDRHPLWRPKCKQLPGTGPQGVVIELELMEGKEQ